MNSHDSHHRLDFAAADYLDALERGDFDAMAELWRRALTEHELGAVLREVHAGLIEEQEEAKRKQQQRASAPLRSSAARGVVMAEREFRETVRALLNQTIEGLSPEQKTAAVRVELVDYLRNQEFAEPNKGKPWTDDQLRVVLSYAPTEENAILLARAFGRGYGSIEQIFRWAGASERRIEEERGDNAFIQQVLRIRKEIRWRSVGGVS
jgi:hypothetical protein